MSFIEWMDKQMGVYPCLRIQPRVKKVKKERPTDTTGMNLHFIKWKKPDSKAIYCMVSFIWHSGKNKTTGTEGEKNRAVSSFHEQETGGGAGCRGERLTDYKGKEETLGKGWDFSIFWFEWQLHVCIHLPRLIEMYTIKGKFYCM